jgi:phospholipid/cholesterol/gamma-HCH transport system substrate-binding protein
MKNTLETRLGVFFALALIVAFLVLEMVGSFDFLKTGLIVRSQFPSVQELAEGDPVKMGGKPIGRVQSIALTNNQVEVVMKLTEAGSVRTDSRATIRFAGLMGQNYVDISFGSPGAPPFDPGNLLASDVQPDLGTLMAKLESVASGIKKFTDSISGQQIQELLGPLTDLVEDNSENITRILGSIQTVTKRIVDGEGTLGRMMKDDTLYLAALGVVTNFDSAAIEIRGALDDARNILGQVRRGEGTIGRLTTDPSLFQEATNSLANLRQILEKINRGQGTIGKIVNDEALYKNVRLSLQKLDKATESLEDQGPLSAIGIAIGQLF